MTNSCSSIVRARRNKTRGCSRSAANASRNRSSGNSHMRVIFMGTPAFALPALRALIDSAHAVVAVYSQPPRPAGRGLKLVPSVIQQLAESHAIPVFTPTSLKSPDIQAEFAAHNADVAIVAAYGLLLPQTVLDAPRFGCINIHPSDLPRGRGAAPIQRTLMAGDTTTACCIIRLEAGLDTGPILTRAAYAIPPSMNAGELHDVMADIGAGQILDVLSALQNGTSHSVPQRTEGVTYAEKISKADRTLDWAQPAATLLHHIRGLSPVPAAVTELNGEIIKIFNALVEPGDARHPPGTRLDDALLINAADGQALRLTALQRPGKARQSAPEFLKGFPVPANTPAKSSG